MPETEHFDDHTNAVRRILLQTIGHHTVDTQVQDEYQLLLQLRNDPQYNLNIAFQIRFRAMKNLRFIVQNRRLISELDDR